MSSTTSVALLAKTVIAPPVPAGTIAALDFTRPSTEFRVDATGCGLPVGHRVRKPSGPVGTAATFREYAWAFAGMPQTLLGTVKLRVPPPLICGPPKGPAVLRVSATR